ncbi:hypothetical protein HUZ36_10905 [Pseudoalteromonas sp. McH1-7]|uniref:hypothetical protein n=1 Tax=Pseudoalteromonas TaxID=53246 RepID=UPI001590B4E3|nr:MULTISPECIES: hypothetical protein [Pseudoalteromonas]MDW7547715.1 hypothetical protein [Pseudoalteromonas peptidolytica]NUZ11291.1 hypothetical protein [Pseudoalteromonas sp. McH1-7]USD27663.1 hypothetical protein J8Z24_11955 [Pseudoalteromonas sp. SCSIO 43201]
MSIINKHYSLALSALLLFGCNQLSETQPIWKIAAEGIIFNGQLQTHLSATSIQCEQCEVVNQTDMRPSGPANYTLVSESSKLKAIWGKSGNAALYIPNNVGRTLINLAPDTETGVWLMDLDSTPKPLKVGKVNYVMLGAQTYQVVISPTSKRTDFEYAVLVK